MNNLSDHPRSLEWLRQFDYVDTHSARLMIDSLKLVSTFEVESSLQGMVKSILQGSSGKVALVPMSKEKTGRESDPGSEDRIGHAMTNVRREYAQVMISPSENDMRDEAVTDIVIIDDFIASGGRLREFWEAWATPKIKSWISFGYCRVWVVCYAIAYQGKAVLNAIRSLNKADLRYEIELGVGSRYWPEAILQFIEKNSVRTGTRGFYSHGIGDVISPIVFEYGCPDNCPAILWSSGPEYNALFPNRSVPSEMGSVFRSSPATVRNTELLWRSGQKKLALALIDDLRAGRGHDRHEDMLMMLGMMSRGASYHGLGKILLFEKSKLEPLRKSCEELGLMSSGEITKYGRELVARSKRKIILQGKANSENRWSEELYIPQQFRRIKGWRPAKV